MGNSSRLEFEPYMDLLAAEIGALPRLWCRPGLWRVLLAGPPVAARYRLDGPGRTTAAARILRAGNRSEAPREPTEQRYDTRIPDQTTPSSEVAHIADDLAGLTPGTQPHALGARRSDAARFAQGRYQALLERDDPAGVSRVARE